MTKQFAVFIAMLLVASCTFDPGRSYFQPYSLTNVDVTRTSGFNKRAYRKEDSVSIVAQADRGSLAPLRDVTCVIRETGYFAEFKPPALVNLPNFGHISPVVQGTCQRGEITRTFKIFPEKIGGPDPYDNSGVWGAVTDILFDGAAPLVRSAFHDEADDIYEYERSIKIEFPDSQQ